MPTAGFETQSVPNEGESVEVIRWNLFQVSLLRFKNQWNVSRKVTTPVRTGVKRVLIIVQNLPVPFDRRVWSEALALRNAGYTVSIIRPKGQGYEDSGVTIDDIHVYRHGLPFEASGALGYFIEYSFSLFWQLVLTLKAARRPGFDVIHACNPPDLIRIV
jgi:hypothetical protein